MKNILVCFIKNRIRRVMQKSTNNQSKKLIPTADFKPGFHYGNQKNLISKGVQETKKSSFQIKEELQSFKKPQSPSIISVFKNLFCCQQEKPKTSPKKSTMKPQLKPIISPNLSHKESQASMNISSGPPQKSIEGTLIENCQVSTANSNPTQEITSKSNIIPTPEPTPKENHYKITKSMLLESDLFSCPLETLFILRKDVGICNLIAKIKFVDFFLNDTNTNLSKKSLSNPNSNLANKNFFNLMSFEKESDFLSFKKEPIDRKTSVNFKGKGVGITTEEKNWTEKLKSKTPDIDQQILLAFYEKNMILDYDQWKNVTPEQCAKYTAKRVKNKGIVIDAFCGIGGNLIYVIFLIDIFF